MDIVKTTNIDGRKVIETTAKKVLTKISKGDSDLLLGQLELAADKEIP
jgi:molybdate-binding protein